MADVRAWLRLARPHFLVGGVAFYVLGVLLARAQGLALGWEQLVLGQAFVTLTQLGVHLANEAHDVDVDRANLHPSWLAGGSRVLVEGRLGPRSVLAVARLLYGAAALAGASALALAPAASRWWLAAILGATLGLSWAYSAPPLRLHSRGIGGLVVGSILAGLVPGLALLQAGAELDLQVAWVLGPALLATAGLVGALSLPDAEGDAAAGKRTLAVRIGVRPAGRVLQVAWGSAGLLTLASLPTGRETFVALAGGVAFALVLSTPMLVGLRRWNALAVWAMALVATQWAVSALDLA